MAQDRKADASGQCRCIWGRHVLESMGQSVYAGPMSYIGFDHIVLSCHDLPAMLDFYQNVLGARVGEERPGKWAIWFGPHKISLQNEASKPALAQATTPGSGNFCVLTERPVAEIARNIRGHGVYILDEGEKQGAQGAINSIYFRDPEGNLVEISNRL